MVKFDCFFWWFVLFEKLPFSDTRSQIKHIHSVFGARPCLFYCTASVFRVTSLLAVTSLGYWICAFTMCISLNHAAILVFSRNPVQHNHLGEQCIGTLVQVRELVVHKLKVGAQLDSARRTVFCCSDFVAGHTARLCAGRNPAARPHFFNKISIHQFWM